MEMVNYSVIELPSFLLQPPLLCDLCDQKVLHDVHKRIGLGYSIPTIYLEGYDAFKSIRNPSIFMLIAEL